MGLFAIKNTLKVPSWFLCMLLLVVTSFRVLMSKNEVELKRKRNKVNLQQVSARWLLTKERFSTEFDLRSDGELFLQRPTIKSSATLGDRSFALAAPTLWKELPTEIRHANSILTLRPFYLKKHFISLINLLA